MRARDHRDHTNVSSGGRDTQCAAASEPPQDLAGEELERDRLMMQVLVSTFYIRMLISSR